MNAGDLLRPRAWRHALLGAVLALLAAPAFALGLGQIRVKSQPGQPLLAEIPIVSSDPAELQGLQARLASPETFRRVGLEPPQGIVSDLQFTPAVDERGQPVIRVTSRVPVQQAGLTFLLEVDWGQGRLVREYSALVDAPRTVAAPVAPPVTAPVTAPAGVIERPTAPAAAPVGAPTPAPAPAPVANTPAPAPAAPPAAAVPSAAPAEAAEYGPVQRGQTLAQIASGLPGTGGYSLDQTMLALLRANPDAFIGEDIHRLRAGSVLRIPGSDELARYDASQAAAIVREQTAAWRQSRRAQAQPAVAAAQTEPRAAPTGAQATPRRAADARLEIAPPQASAGTRAGTQSGASAGGEGDMLRQELQQTKETLAARDAEVRELQARLAELERLQQEQQKLIAMKDSSLAAAQQRLANPAATQPATAAATQAPQAEPQASGFAWWWLLPVALLVGAVAWWFGRRAKAQKRAEPEPASGTRISDSFAAGSGPVATADPVSMPASDPAAASASDRAVAPATPEPAAPVWASRARPAPMPAKPPPKAAAGTPTWMAGAGEADAIAPLNASPAGSERLELARAYAELGDRNTARSLLQEVVDSGDADSREAAARMLQTLG
jgi:pilus assembly protein FimV